MIRETSECTFNASGFNQGELEHFAAVVRALGIDMQCKVSKSGRTATVHVVRMPSVYDAETMRTRRAGRRSNGIRLPKNSIFNDDTSCMEFLCWQKNHTVMEGMEQLGLSRATYYRRINAMKERVSEAERLNPGRAARGMKPLRPLLVNVD